VLAPARIKAFIFPWTDYGDFVLLVFLLAGLIMVPFFWKLLRKRRAALVFFIAAAIVSAGAISLDSLDMEKYGNQAFRMEQFFEELLETTAMILFLNAFFYSLTGILRKAGEQDGTTGPVSPANQPTPV
jgi:cation transport ATPase